ncbi:MAG: Fe(2+)-trafficking protein [Phycisphaeraceae bacterium]
MASIEERIEQWERMAAEVPDDMAFFSLGGVYREAGRHEDAAGAFAKAIEMNPGMSRAYQLRAQSLIDLGREDEAAETLTEGYRVAGERGDVMPQRAMGSLLEKLGREVPEVASAEERKQEVEQSGDVVLDRRTGEPQPRLDDPPMRGPLGEFIHDHFGQETWRAWIAQGTKVINELRLDFSNPEHQEVYDHYMMEWLQITPEEVEQYAREKKQEG